MNSTPSRIEADRRVESVFARHKRGELELAYAAYREVLQQFPDHSRALHYLGLIAQQTGHPHEAVRLLQRSITVEPSDPRTHNHLGQVWVGLKDKDAALACFEEAVELDPRHADSLNNLANAVRVRDPQRAIELYRRALEINPASVDATYNLANLLDEERDADAALALYQRALAIDPNHVRAHRNLAILLEQRGQFDEAIGHYEKVLAIRPRHASALANLIAIRSYEPSEQMVRDAEALLAADTAEEERIKLHSGLGKHYDRECRHGEAFEHFLSAKRLVGQRGAGFNARRIAEQFDRTMAMFSREWFAHARAGGSDSRQPIFIVGMPRSGTTLTEQILASHPHVSGAGELPDLPRILKGLRPGYPANVAGFDGNRLVALANEYLSGLRAQAPSQVLRVTDKLPSNFVHLGMIATLFPGAHVVHCRRDPMDTGLSCLIELFDMEGDYTTRLEDFGEYFLQYERLMAHWREVLPIRMHEQRYEDLVADPEAHARALVEYCGLEWDPACLDFQRLERTVRTPSRWQVRQPIYMRSVGRWRNYATQMEPLRQLLDSNGYRYSQ
jgi:tetratricopeptide (TPR) repeat protein